MQNFNITQKFLRGQPNFPDYPSISCDYVFIWFFLPTTRFILDKPSVVYLLFGYLASHGQLCIIIEETASLTWC